MKNARTYLKTLYNAQTHLMYWLRDGEFFIEDMGREKLLQWIGKVREKVVGLDAEDVKDEILVRDDNIEMRLERLLDYRMEDVVRYAVEKKGKVADVGDARVDDALNDLKTCIERKVEDLVRVWTECERHLPHRQNEFVMKAMECPELLRIFKYNKKVLSEYIMYCINAKKGSQMAQRAAELCGERKIKVEDLNKKLHTQIINIGIDAGTYDSWKGATKRTLQK